MKESDTRNSKKQAQSACVSRRGFISACSACATCLAFNPGSFLIPPAAREQESKMKIRIIYSLHAPVQNQPDWPNVGFDFNPVMDRINNSMKCSFPEFEFVSSMAAGQEDAEKIVLQDQKENTGGYIVYQMNCWNRVVQTIAKTGKPVLYADFQFAGSGGFLVYTATFLNENTPNVGFVASSKMEDAIAIGCTICNERRVSSFRQATERVDRVTPASVIILSIRMRSDFFLLRNAPVSLQRQGY